MLVELHIRDFALIDQIDIEFGPGLNVLTGETGAGKSIVVDALQLAVGGRASAEFVRTGREQASVTAVFEVDDDSPAVAKLRAMDMLDEEDPGRIILRRDVSASGRSRARINGRPATVSQLQAVGESLVDVHGQHDHQSLLRGSNQLLLLDLYGGDGVTDLAARFAEAWRRLVETRKELASLRQDERERARRLDLVRFQIEEIEAAGLEPGEEEKLKQEQARLSHLGRLQRETARLHGALSDSAEDGSPGAVDVLEDGAHTVAGLAEIDAGLAEAATLLEDAALRAREAAALLRDYGAGLEADPGALEAVASRLALIADLRRKYGADIEEILAFAADLSRERERLEGSDDREGQLAELATALEGSCADLAARLSRARRRAADELERAVSRELEGLHMGPGRFVVALDKQPAEDGLKVDGQRWQAGSSGIDHVQFMLSANPGEPPRPLARIASGGELSRIALALKRCFVEVDPVPVLVFDEVDAGIGGRTAQAVAGRLDDVGRRRQVICVTHLAQIATAADGHLHIRKTEAAGRTVVSVTPLHDELRVEEIARMLAGVLTETTLDNARELIRLARKTKSANEAS